MAAEEVSIWCDTRVKSWIVRKCAAASPLNDAGRVPFAVFASLTNQWSSAVTLKTPNELCKKHIINIHLIGAIVFTCVGRHHAESNRYGDSTNFGETVKLSD